MIRGLSELFWKLVLTSHLRSPLDLLVTLLKAAMKSPLTQKTTGCDGFLSRIQTKGEVRWPADLRKPLVLSFLSACPYSGVPIVCTWLYKMWFTYIWGISGHPAIGEMSKTTGICWYAQFTIFLILFFIEDSNIYKNSMLFILKPYFSFWECIKYYSRGWDEIENQKLTVGKWLVYF